ncbi:MAG: electron transfer flavoprotein subunit alpha/FixB family protein [bacterium]
MNERRIVWVYLENRNGEASTPSLSLLREGARLAVAAGAALEAVAFGPIAPPPGAAKLLDVRLSLAPEKYPCLRRRALARLAGEHNPLIFLFPATTESRTLAALTAVELAAPLAPDCTFLRIAEDATLHAAREAYAGRLSETIHVRLEARRTAVVSALPESLPARAAQPCEPRAETVVVPFEHDEDDLRIRLVDRRTVTGGDEDVGDAEVVVSGGRGVGAKENFELLRRLAELLGGTVAGTRGAVERGWIERGRQVGQTGRTVAPELYFACGLSGAPQHLLGMKNSRRVAAVNTDAHAPIFAVADFGVVGDLFEVVPALIEKIGAAGASADRDRFSRLLPGSR